VQLRFTVRRAFLTGVLGVSLASTVLFTALPSAEATNAPIPQALAQQIDEAATLALYSLATQPAVPPAAKTPEPITPADAGPTTPPMTPPTGSAEPVSPAEPAATAPSGAEVSPTAPTEPAAPVVVTYADRLATLAALVAPRVGVDATELAAVWVRTDRRRMIAVITAIGQVGDRYQARGSGPDAFDCSGLFWFSWHQAGVSVPRTSTGIIQAAKPVRQDQLQPGDVVWRPGHVLMALGLGHASVDSPESGRAVQVAPWGSVKRFGSPI